MTSCSIRSSCDDAVRSSRGASSWASRRSSSETGGVDLTGETGVRPGSPGGVRATDKASGVADTWTLEGTGDGMDANGNALACSDA